MYVVILAISKLTFWLFSITPEETANLLHMKGNIDDIHHFTWFHGRISAEEAEGCLREKSYDCYLIRQSEECSESPYLVTVKENGIVNHLQVDGDSDGFVIVGCPPKFASLSILVSYFEKHPIVLTTNKYQLTVPCPKSYDRCDVTSKKGVFLFNYISFITLSHFVPFIYFKS